MADEPTPPKGEQEQEQPDMTALLAQLEALTASQTALQTQLATQATPQEAEPVPPPAPPPEPVGRVTREQYAAMQQYAAQRSQDAEKYKLAAQHGLQPEDLDGEFASPQAMQQYAELLALRENVQALEQSLQASLAPPTQPEGEEEEEPAVPPEDAGGPTGTQSPKQVAQATQYEAAKALGRTVEGRRAMMQAIYNDPSKQSVVRER